MRLGTMTSLFRTQRECEEHIGYIESMRRCREAGFEILDFNMCAMPRRQTTLHHDDWKQQVDEIRNEAEKLGITFVQSHPPYRGMRDSFLNSTEEGRKFFDDMLLRSIEISAMLGVKWAVMHPVGVAGVPGYDTEANILENKRVFAKELELSAKLGVGLAFENMCDGNQRRRFSSTPQDLIALMDALDSQYVGLCWDVGHANRVCEDQIPAIMMLGDRIKALHIDDNMGKEDAHLMPFLGTMDWEGIMHALCESGCKADLIYEININNYMPNALKDASARYCYEVGQYLLSLYR